MPRASGRRHNPKGRHSRRSVAEQWRIGAGIAGCALVVVAIVVIFVLRPEPTERDSETLCPTSGPSAVTAILVDTTDRLGPVSRADVLAHLHEEVSSGSANELFLAFETQATEPSGVPEPLFEVCHPGHPEDANPLIESEQRIEKRLEERFLAPLAQVFKELLDREPAASSPLMESTQVAAVTVLGRRDYADVPKRLLLVSDLMQNTDSLSFFRQVPDYSEFVSTSAADQLSTNLGATDVEILFVQRRAHARLRDAVARDTARCSETGDRRTRSLIEFWCRWIEDQGGTLRRVVRINGMN